MMQDQLRPVSSHAPEPIIVEIEGVGELEFPGDTDQSVIQAKVRELTTPQTPEHPHARTWRLVKENAPLVAGAMTAPFTGGMSLPAAAAVTGGAAYLGGRVVRGDDRATAASAGLKEGLTQGIGGLAVKGGRAGARFLMRGGIPKGIQSDFGGRRVAEEALDTLAIPGSQQSADRVGRLSREANQARDAAASQVPALSPKELVSGFRPMYDEAVEAMAPDRAKAIAEYARKSGRETRGGLSGKGQLARKTIKQQEGKVALNADNPKTAAVGSQLANTERDIIASHLRNTPGMEHALDKSQRRMGLDRFMQDSLTSNMINRMGGGPINMMRSPMGLGLTAHVVNQGSRAVSPQMLRAIQIAMLGQDQ